MGVLPLLAACVLLLNGSAAIHAPGPTAGAPRSIRNQLPKHAAPLTLRLVGGEKAAPPMVMPTEGLGEWGWGDTFDRVVYRLQNVMLSSPAYKFLTIITFMGFFIMIGASIIKAVEYLSGAEPQSWNVALFTAYSLIADAPGADAVEVEGIHVISRNIIFFFGIFTFAIVLGVITATIEQQVDFLLAANHRVVEKDHTVMLNWSERTIPIIRQIAETKGYKATPVVIMADKDVDEMRSEIEEGLGDLKLAVTVRSGCPTFVSDLEKVAIGYASQVMILNPDGQDEVTAKVQCVCSSVLQQRCQPRKKHGFGDKDLHTVVVQSAPSDLPELLGFTPVRRSQMVQRAIAGSVVGHGLSAVFTDIFTAGDGCQIYVTDLALWPWLAGQTFEQISVLFPDSVVLGWMSEAQNGKWDVDICPHNTDVATKGMKLVMLAASQHMRCSRRTPTLRAIDFVAVKSCVALARSQRGTKMSMVLNVLDGNTYLPDRISKGGDKVKVVPFSQCQELSLVQLKAMGLLNIDVLVLQHFRNEDGTVSSDSDAKVITTCKMIALLRRQAATEGKAISNLHLVACMHRAESVSLLQTVCTNPGMSVEFMNSNEVEAGAIVQMLSTPALKPVYTALLEAGSDLFLIPAPLLFTSGLTYTFSDISRIVMQRKAVAIGVKRADGNFELSPAKNKRIMLQETDQIIVVADFE